MNRMAELMDVLSHGAAWREYFAPPTLRRSQAPAPAPEPPPPPRVTRRRPDYTRMVLEKLGVGPASTRELSAMTGFTWKTVRNVIARLAKAGKVRQTGAGKFTRWQLERCVPVADTKEPIPDTTIVKCRGCGQDKPASEYYRRPTGDLREKCKECFRVRRRAEYLAQREAGD